MDVLINFSTNDFFAFNGFVSYINLKLNYMSYSRWGGSRFYTFWCGNNEVKKDQLFDIMFDYGRELRFTYAELKKDMEACLNQCEELCSKEIKWKMRKSLFPPSEEFTDEIELAAPFINGDREELKSYMVEFMNDMDKYYPKSKK